MRGIVGEERRGKETDGCPLTHAATYLISKVFVNDQDLSQN
jgi:hypothetical protein